MNYGEDSPVARYMESNWEPVRKKRPVVEEESTPNMKDAVMGLYEVLGRLEEDMARVIQLVQDAMVMNTVMHRYAISLYLASIHPYDYEERAEEVMAAIKKTMREEIKRLDKLGRQRL